MKGRIDGDYIIYDEGTEDYEPIKLHINFAGFSEEHHLSELLDLKKQWDQTFELPTFWRTELDIAWGIENHRIALEYEYGHTRESISEKLKDLDERQSLEDLDRDMDDR